MKDISIYFSPLSRSEEQNTLKIGGSIQCHTESGFPLIEKNGVALLYVPEFRGDHSMKGREVNAESFRSYLYELYLGLDWKMPLYDLGDILPGNGMNDTYFALSQVVAELVKNKVVPIVVGGSQDLTIALYKGYEKLEQTINLCCVDHKLDLGEPEIEPHSDGFVSQLLLQRPCYLFNHANIGLQSPFASKAEFDLFEKLYFDILSLIHI